MEAGHSLESRIAHVLMSESYALANSASRPRVSGTATCLHFEHQKGQSTSVVFLEASKNRDASSRLMKTPDGESWTVEDSEIKYIPRATMSRLQKCPAFAVISAEKRLVEKGRLL